MPSFCHPVVSEHVAGVLSISHFCRLPPSFPGYVSLLLSSSLSSLFAKTMGQSHDEKPGVSSSCLAHELLGVDYHLSPPCLEGEIDVDGFGSRGFSLRWASTGMAAGLSVFQRWKD